jgi:two-component system NtrC family sensor kinase
MATTTTTSLPRWDLAAEAIVVKIRWFGLLLGFAYVNFGQAEADRLTLNSILLLGLAYTLLDTWFYRRQRVFLGNYPLLVSGMESLFIGLLCFFESDLDSPFRNYYILSLLCCAIRHSFQITYVTFLMHCFSYGLLYLSLPNSHKAAFSAVMLIVVLAWLTWASSAMSRLLKQIGEHLGILNQNLSENQALLETRIEERTRELQETQAQLMHQDKMAGFGLLAAGIAHEVGNPLTSISTIVQVLERRNPDDYTRDKLGLVGGQLSRIQGILRELTTFSRPANPDRARFTIREIVDEALSIAKYYKGTKTRTMTSSIPDDLPILFGVRDQLVQVVFNLVLNAIDATNKGGTIAITAERKGASVEVMVADNGVGIPAEQAKKLFQPYFTTKKQGTGLGLFVIQKIVREHGGEVTFTSEEGKGTMFSFQLPGYAERK